MKTTAFSVEGMHCDGCAERIRTLLGREPGVREARVSFDEGSVGIRYDPHRTGEAQLRKIIETGGFHVIERPA